MKTFLVLVNLEGTIIEIMWCDPVSLIDKKIGNIREIFERQVHESVMRSIFECSNDSKLLVHLEHQPLYVSQISLDLYGIKSNNGVYIFALQDDFCHDSIEKEQLHRLISHFMFLQQTVDHKLGFHNPESSRFQFEEIQLLNNELVNTKRKLEKSNAQLNVLNKELNNRLVKDPLTGLVSRYQYRSEIEYQISQHQDKLGVFMFIDMDDFKKINDTYGHQIGDDYLIEFANRLKNMPLPNSVKLRIAGDEFGVFIYGLNSVENSDLESYWELIKHYIIDQPLVIDHNSLVFSLSCGMAIYGQDTDEIYEIIEYADFAMYHAKKTGKNRYAKFDLKEYENLKSKKSNK